MVSRRAYSEVISTGITSVEVQVLTLITPESGTLGIKRKLSDAPKQSLFSNPAESEEYAAAISPLSAVDSHNLQVRLSLSLFSVISYLQVPLVEALLPG